ncbi:MAG: hypothetical protein IJH78_03135 [Clostridia bacterium]|nr:hypothetical protein [Clostridia bacterium]
MKKKRRAVYSPRLCGALLQHFSGPSCREVREITYHPNGEVKQEKEVRASLPLPTFEDFAWQRGLTTETLRRWEEEHEEFREACELARIRQRHLLITEALTGDYNAAFARFLACALCGLSAQPAEAKETLPAVVDDL